MICQKTIDPRGDQVLNCPSDGHRQVAGVVYGQFAERFSNMTQMSAEMSAEPLKPQHLKLQILFQENTIANITDLMILQKGKWHLRCFLQYNRTEYNRLEERLSKRMKEGALDTEAKKTDHVLAKKRHQGPFPTDLEPEDDSRNDDRRKSLRVNSGDFNLGNTCIFHKLVSSETLINLYVSIQAISTVTPAFFVNWFPPRP